MGRKSNIKTPSCVNTTGSLLIGHSCSNTITSNHWINDGITILPTTTTGVASYGTTALYNWGTQKKQIYPKDGDLFIDPTTMECKVYDSEEGWIECELEYANTEIINGKKYSKFIILKYISVSSMIKKREERKVLTEKVIKNVVNFNFSGTGLTLQGLNLNTIGGYNNITIGNQIIHTGTNNINFTNGTINFIGNNNLTIG